MAKRNVVDFKIINLSEEKFQELKEAGQIDPNALYATPDTTKERLGALEGRATNLEATKQDKATAVNYDNITNCITHIPQDIKLELNNGTLTLKAGSKVYMPNGFETDGVTKKFDVINIVSDVVLTQGWGSSQTFCLAVNKDGSGMAIYDIARTYSGTFTSFSAGFYYEEDKNLINIYDNGVLNRQISFPIAIITGHSPTFDSIDQVFNGFGYIGSTMFILPGVSILIPDGLKEDGSLKNRTYTTTGVSTRTNTDTGDGIKEYLLLRNDGSIFQANAFYEQEEKPSFVENQNQYWYNPATNRMFYYRSSSKSNFLNDSIIVASFGLSGTKIDKFTPNDVFHAVDYSDTDFIAHQAMPSDRYVDLTLGASGSSYKAPADGYLVIRKTATAANQYVYMKSGEIFISTQATTNDSVLEMYVPVQGGKSCVVSYNAGGSTGVFRFVYANGAK